MVPRRLALRNFLSYGATAEPLDFSGVQVACLCGPNGHGKSALLDAITWALWGEARTRSAADLARLGQPEMAVDFEFLLEDREHRVVRRWHRGRNLTDLQFQVREADGEWRSQGGQGVRETQARLRRALRMDYQTFINSAFLVQGRADEFTRRTAAERKEVLAEVLSLSLYDALCERARGREREAAGTAAMQEEVLRRLEAEVARLPELQAAVEERERALAAARLEAVAARAAEQAALKTQAVLEAREREAAGLRGQCAEARRQESALRRELEEARTALNRDAALLARAEQIRERAAALEAARAARAALEEKQRRHLELQARRTELLGRLQSERTRRAAQLTTLTRDAAQLEAAAAPAGEGSELRLALGARERQLEQLDDVRRTLEAVQQEGAHATAALAAIPEARQEALRLRDELLQQFEVLKRARSVCPLCEGELTEEKRREVGWTLRKRKDEQEKRLQELEAQERAAREKVQQCGAQQARLARELQRADRLIAEIGALKEKLQRAVEAADAVPAVREAVARAEAELQAEEFAAEVRTELARVEAEQREVSFNAQELAAARAREEALRDAPDELRRLERAQAGREAATARIRSLEEGLERHVAAAARGEERLSELERELGELPAARAEAARCIAASRRAAEQETAAAGARAAAAAAVSACAAQQEELGRCRALRDTAAVEALQFRTLAQAFGKNGIQALIIENALPELEREANELLFRMSDGELAVRLLTQRNTRAGGTVETLDIEISDRLGPRRYELFSGGEAFRVNFALRIALSKLLARRAGARLETLIVDEGFGSQDQDGRQRLVEAIQAVRDDFRMILVITHIDELKDAFPTRIEVTKGPEGSRAVIT